MKNPAQRNLELSLEGIRADVVAETAALEAVLADKTAAEEELASLRDARHSETVEMERRRTTLDERESQVAERERAFEAGASGRREELAGIGLDVREASKELARLNAWIMAAKDDQASRERDMAVLDATIAEKRAVSDEIALLRDEQALEERRRAALRLENSLAIEDAAARLKTISAEAEAAEERTLKALDLTASAMSSRDALVKEKERIQSDLEIYIRRVEAKYEEAFPGLRMII